MSDYYYFFFSYAHGNHENSVLGRSGKNFLDEFYDSLCRQVSELTGRPATQVAFRDDNRLKISEYWNQSLVNGLQKSRVLLSLVSPHYIQSDNCGRELSVFDRRLKAYRNTGGTQSAHRIMPLFWQHTGVSLQNISPGAYRFFSNFQHTQSGMHPDYPATGLSQLLRLCTDPEYERLCIAIAQRIVELATLDPLPELEEQKDFSSLESLYTRLDAELDDSFILSGPDSVNVVYLVGTRDEMVKAVAETARYADDPKEWIPFPQAIGSSVKILTEEGANVVGLRNHRHFDLPDDLIRLIETAERQNSPVLLVFDRKILSVSEKVERINSYFKQNFDNCGLVTAGGEEIPDGRVEAVFQLKFRMDYPNHMWNVPANREEYISSVVSVLGGIKKYLIMRGQTAIPMAAGTIPGLCGPGVN